VLEQLESSLRARNEHALDTEARRYEAFQRGLRRLVPCRSERPSLAQGRCLDIHRHPASGIDHLYLQMVRLVDHDVLGPSSSLTYPAALHHTRTWMGLQFGDRPRWAPPYIRIEGANPGFRVLQGFSLLPRRWAPMPVLDRFRGEIGLHPTWKSAPSQLWMPLRLGLETPVLPGVRWLSLFPSWTFSVPLTDSTIPPRPGVDLVAFDVVHLRLDLVEGKRPDITAGLRTGFDPATLVEGLITGTTGGRDRRHPRRR
jgi:hypothetical protein